MGYTQVAQAAFQSGNFTQAEITYQAAITETKLPDWRAVESQVAQRFICQSGAAAQIQMCKARAMGGDSSQALILKGEAVAHV